MNVWILTFIIFLSVSTAEARIKTKDLALRIQRDEIPYLDPAITGPTPGNCDGKTMNTDASYEGCIKNQTLLGISPEPARLPSQKSPNLGTFHVPMVQGASIQIPAPTTTFRF